MSMAGDVSESTTQPVGVQRPYSDCRWKSPSAALAKSGSASWLPSPESVSKSLSKKKIKNMDRFKQEIIILQQLDHPNVLKLYEYFEDKKNVYLITELDHAIHKIFCAHCEIFIAQTG